MLRKWPVLSFYLLTFALSWGCLLAVIGGPSAIPGDGEQVQRKMAGAVFALIGGPAVAGVLLTGLLEGAAGLRALRSRLLRARVPLRWYAAALVTAPAAMVLLVAALSAVSPEFTPPIVRQPALVLLGAVAVVFGGLLEEIGWTGFAIPRLLPRLGAARTGALAGVLWGAWHFPMNLWTAGGSAGAVPYAWFAAAYLAAGVAQLTAYRLLMVRVYERTGSALLATLMHGSLIASTAMPILVPPVTGGAFLAWFGASAAMFWIAAAAAYKKKFFFNGSGSAGPAGTAATSAR